MHLLSCGISRYQFSLTRNAGESSRCLLVGNLRLLTIISRINAWSLLIFMVSDKRGKKPLRGISLGFKNKTLLTVDKTRSLGTPSPPLYTTAQASHFKTYKLIKYLNSLGPFSNAINQWFWSCLPLWTATYMSTLRLVLWHYLHFSCDARMLKIQQYNRKTRSIRTFSWLWTPHLEFTPTVTRPYDTAVNPIIFTVKTKLKTFLFSQHFHHHNWYLSIPSFCHIFRVCV